jgi:hypothetical protein
LNVTFTQPQTVNVTVTEISTVFTPTTVDRPVTINSNGIVITTTTQERTTVKMQNNTITLEASTFTLNNTVTVIPVASTLTQNFTATLEASTFTPAPITVNRTM